MLTIYVCMGSSCYLKNSYAIIEELQNLINQHNLNTVIELNGAFCLGRCTEGVSVKINTEDLIYSLNIDSVTDFFKENVLRRIQS